MAVDLVCSGYTLHPACASCLDSFSTCATGRIRYLVSVLPDALARGWPLPPV